MGADVVCGIAAFPGAVLSGRDVEGHPFSVRCTPRAVPAERVLRARRAAGVDLVDGPASLLCHSFDDGLDALRSLPVRGELRTLAEEWVFTPAAVVPGLGMDGPLADTRAFLAARRRAARYLHRRGLPRPRVPWATIRQRP